MYSNEQMKPSKREFFVPFDIWCTVVEICWQSHVYQQRVGNPFNIAFARMKESVYIHWQSVWDMLVYHKETSINEMDVCNPIPLCSPQKIPRKIYTKICILISQGLEEQARRAWLQFFFTYHYPECLLQWECLIALPFP